MNNYITEQDFLDYMGKDAPAPFQMWYDLSVQYIITVCPCLKHYIYEEDCTPSLTSEQIQILKTALILQTNYVAQYDSVVNSPQNTTNFTIGDYQESYKYDDSLTSKIYPPVLDMLYNNFNCDNWLKGKLHHKSYCKDGESDG